MTPECEAFLSEVREKTDSALQLLLQDRTGNVQSQLTAAMRYAVLNGGKRIRPALCFAAAVAARGNMDQSDQDAELEHNAVLTAACSVELIHAYSLVHDDLPAMDNDDLRRGKPTTHIAFDEATALLAGDALQTRAFEILAECQSLKLEAKLACIRQLAMAAGADGMCGGQMIDLEAVGHSLSIDELAAMHALKTGALIRASVLLGALACGQTNTPLLTALTTFANAAGLAFQVKDDILDVTADTATLGKPQGSDAERNKPTYVSLLGLDGAQEKLETLHGEALEAIKPLGDSSQRLAELTSYIVQRAS